MNEKWMIVNDNRESEKYDEVMGGFPVFNPDGKLIAYGAKQDGKWKVEIDNINEVKGLKIPKIRKFFSIQKFSISSVTFSPDEKHIPYVAQTGKKRIAVIDGNKGKPYDDIEGIVFSPKSKRVAYLAQIIYGEDDHLHPIVIDGKAGPRYNGIVKGKSFVTFSYDGKHIAYAGIGVNHGKWHLVVDGYMGKESFGTICNVVLQDYGFDTFDVDAGVLYRLAWNPNK